jgi:probable rRNA maturation factor
MPVELTSKRRMRGVRAADVRREARRLLRTVGIDAELSVALVGDAEMHALNARYLGKNRPTDVLAFPVDADTQARYNLLGDVVISLDTAARQAAQRRTSVADEVRLLLVHGVLHLVGHDHERSRTEARRMFALQRRLVAWLTEDT